MIPVPLLDLQAQFSTIQDEVEQAVLDVVRQQRFILGPEVDALEREISSYVGTAHAIGVSSGSDALLACLQALGVGPGDEVITSAFSFFASAGAIARLRAKPVLVDIEPSTFNLDPGQVADRTTPSTKAILPVHLFGRCAAVEVIAEAAGDIPIIEDAAQAIGAERKGGRAGSLGRAGCLSFFPSKNLGGYGDGGMVTTDDEKLFQSIRALRVHGQMTPGQYLHDLVGGMVGGNFRLDAIQAAVLRVKLRHLETWTEDRRRNAARYRELLAEASAKVVLPPVEDPACRDVYNQFVIRVHNRDGLRDHLKRRGIGCAVYYPRGLHLQPCFADLGHREGDFPASEAAARESLALPVYPELTEEQQGEVVRAVVDFVGT